MVVKVTILMELKGIKTAAITGDSFPVTAKYNPITLYTKDMRKAMRMTFMDSLPDS